MIHWTWDGWRFKCIKNHTTVSLPSARPHETVIFFFFNHSVRSNNPNFLPPAAAIDFTLCVKLHLPALASAANEFQTERKKEEEEEKKQGISHCSPSFSLDHNNTISIYNFNC